MDRKMLTIILAAVLIGCFFLSYINLGMFGSASGFDIVFQSDAERGSWERFLWLLIPVPAILLLIGALNNESYILGRGLLSWLPLLTVIYIFVRFYLDAKSDGASVPIGEFIKAFGIGYWITFAASLVLAFYNPKPKA